MVVDIAILIGRKGSKGFPNKNTKKVGKKNLCEYPLIAAKKVKSIKRIFVATDCEKIKRIAKKYKVEFIDRPKKLNTDKALGEDVYKYCYEIAKRRMQTNGEKIRYIVLLMANAPMINSNIINQGIKRLNKNKNADSAVTVSKYNMWSPIRARKINNSGFLNPFIPFNKMGLKTINCDRDVKGTFIMRHVSFDCKTKMYRANRGWFIASKMDGTQDFTNFFKLCPRFRLCLAITSG